MVFQYSLFIFLFVKAFRVASACGQASFAVHHAIEYHERQYLAYELRGFVCVAVCTEIKHEEIVENLLIIYAEFIFQHMFEFLFIGNGIKGVP